MQQLEYTRMAEFEKSFWWHKGKLFLVRNLIQIYSEEMKRPLEILEIGCGTGEITQSLMEFGNVKGMEISEEAINYCIVVCILTLWRIYLTLINYDFGYWTK